MFSRTLDQRSIKSWRWFCFFVFFAVYGHFPLERCDYHLRPGCTFWPPGDHDGLHFEGLKRAAQRAPGKPVSSKL